MEVYNIDIIFSRVLYLNSTDKTKINYLSSYKLIPQQIALLKDTGEER